MTRRVAVVRAGQTRYGRAMPLVVAPQRASAPSQRRSGLILGTISRVVCAWNWKPVAPRRSSTTSRPTLATKPD